MLAQLYAGALQAKDITTEIQPVAERSGYLEQLRDGSIGLVPEHTGALLTELDPAQAASTASEIDDQLPKAVGPDLAVIKPAEATAQVTYVTTKAVADQNSIATLDDLAKITDGTVLGGPPGLMEEKYGPAALTAIYGIRFASYQPYPNSAQLADDLGAGKIMVGAFTATDPVLAGDTFVRLEDPESIVLPENVTAVASSAFAGNAEAVAAIEAVHGALTTAELTVLQSQVHSGVPVDQVATDWLKANGIG